MLCCMDFEVFKYDWLVVIVDLIKKEETVIVNDPDKLREFMDSHKNHIFISYNGKSYDNYILKSILAGFNPYEMNEHIITKGLPGWSFDESIRNYNFLSYDAYSELMPSLKKLEGFMGMDIHESNVDFRLDRKLTEEEIRETIEYCRADVNALITVFCKRKEDFESLFEVTKMFDMPLSNLIKTKAQLAAVVLGAEKKEYNDEWDIQIPDCFTLNKYSFVKDWFLDQKNQWDGAKLECEIAGVPTMLGWGGIHGAIPNYFKSGNFTAADISSMYPATLINFSMLSRSVKDPEKFRELRDRRIAHKRAGDKKSAQALKILINSVFGSSGFSGSPLCDKRQCRSTCATGQVALVDLIEKTENFGNFVQYNTDGVYIELYDGCKDKFVSACKEWEQRSGYELEFDDFNFIAQANVNNYVLRLANGKVKAKGAVVKDLSELDYDLPVVNFAVRNYILDQIPPEKTIQDNDNLIDFQKIYHVSALYDRALKNCTFSKESYIKPETGRKNTRTVWNNDGIVFEYERTFRVFASKDPNDGKLYKQKLGKNPESFAGCADHCFIENGNIVGKKCSEYVDKLDKQWYIDEAWRRIEQFYGKSLR